MTTTQTALTPTSTTKWSPVTATKIQKLTKVSTSSMAFSPGTTLYTMFLNCSSINLFRAIKFAQRFLDFNLWLIPSFNFSLGVLIFKCKAQTKAPQIHKNRDCQLAVDFNYARNSQMSPGDNQEKLQNARFYHKTRFSGSISSLIEHVFFANMASL